MELAKLVLLDAAAIQAEDVRHYHHNGPPPPVVYDADDVQHALQRFEGRMEYGVALELAPGIRANFHNAGHILGSAWILLELDEAGAKRRVVFSGDLGNRERPLLSPPDGAPIADVIVMESTYGDRNHRSQAESLAEFRDTVKTTIARGGNVVIPTFALERAQALLFYLRDMVEQHLIPEKTPVYLDSPMAISATEIFRHHPECFNPDVAAMLAAGHDPFTLPGLQFTRDQQASIAINSVRGAVIMAGSGMAAGGRILHHLRHNLAGGSNTVLFVGYAATGTVARQIIDGAKHVHLFGENIPVRAEVRTIGGFSAHAGHDDLLAWAQASGKPGHIYLVHGEGPAAATLARDFAAAGVSASAAAMDQSVDLAAAETARA